MSLKRRSLYDLFGKKNSIQSLEKPNHQEKQMEKDVLEKGVTLASQAVQLDTSGKTDEAIKLYESSISSLQKAADLASDPKRKSMIFSKIEEYRVRSESLKSLQASTQNETPTIEKETTPEAPIPTFTPYPVISPIQQSLAQTGQSQICTYCKRGLGLTESYKVLNNLPYHNGCVDMAIGMTREATKNFFLTSKGGLYFKVSIPRRVYQPGDVFDMQVHVNNESSKKIQFISAYLLKTETYMNTVSTKRGIERKPKSTETKEDGREYYGVNTTFPMERGTVDMDVKFKIPSDLDLSENNGTFSREYELIVKCHLPTPHGQHKLSFPIVLKR